MGYLRNFYRCFTQKVYTQNVQPLPCEWKPCFTCAVLELGQASCPSPHQPFRHFRSMNWQLSKLSANFLKYYTNIYTLSPGFDGLQDGLQCFKKISRKLKKRTKKKKKKTPQKKKKKKKKKKK